MVLQEQGDGTAMGEPEVEQRVGRLGRADRLDQRGDARVEQAVVLGDQLVGHDRVEQRRLVREVAVDAGRGDTGAPGDAGHRGAVEAVLDEQRLARLDDPPADVVLQDLGHVAAVGRRSAHGRAASSSSASPRIVASPPGAATTWMPIGSPSAHARGIDAAGQPATLAIGV